MSITENIAAIRREIDAAARESGRTGADITLVGASKMNDAAACQEAIAAGIDVLGENRVQEMTAKLAEHADLRAGQARFTHVFIHLPAYGFLQDRKAQSLGDGSFAHGSSPRK